MGKTMGRATAYLYFMGGHTEEQDFELVRSDASTYGNGMTVVRSGEGWTMPMLYDVRYDTSIRRDGSNFSEWVQRFICGLTMPTLLDVIVVAS